MSFNCSIVGCILIFIAAVICTGISCVDKGDETFRIISIADFVVFVAGSCMIIFGAWQWRQVQQKDWFQTIGLKDLDQLETTALICVFIILISCLFYILFSFFDGSNYSQIPRRNIVEVAAALVLMTIMFFPYMAIYSSIHHELYDTTSFYCEISSIRTALDEEKGITYTITTADETIYTATENYVSLESNDAFDNTYGEFEIFNHPNDDGSARIKEITIYS